MALSCPAYIIIQGLVIQLLQLCLVIPELDPVQHLCQQQNQGIFVPAATRETHTQLVKPFQQGKSETGQLHQAAVGIQGISSFQVTSSCKETALAKPNIPLPLEGKGRTVSSRNSPRVQNRKSRSSLPGTTPGVHKEEAPRASCSLGCPQQPLLLWALNEEQKNQSSCCCLEPLCAAVSFPTLKFRPFSPETKAAPFLLAL